MKLLNRVLWVSGGIGIGYLFGWIMGKTEEEKQKSAQRGSRVGGLGILGLIFMSI